MANPAETKAIRDALIFFLKNQPEVTSLVPADRLFPQQVPANPVWPYAYTGATIGSPLRASCMDSRVVTLAIHSYARTVAGSAMGETMADDIGDAIASALDGAHIAVGDGFMDVNWITNNTIRDPSEASAFHSICQIECTLVA